MLVGITTERTSGSESCSSFKSSAASTSGSATKRRRWPSSRASDRRDMAAIVSNAAVRTFTSGDLARESGDFASDRVTEVPGVVDADRQPNPSQVRSRPGGGGLDDPIDLAPPSGVERASATERQANGQPGPFRALKTSCFTKPEPPDRLGSGQPVSSACGPRPPDAAPVIRLPRRRHCSSEAQGAGSPDSPYELARAAATRVADSGLSRAPYGQTPDARGMARAGLCAATCRNGSRFWSASSGRERSTGRGHRSLFGFRGRLVRTEPPTGMGESSNSLSSATRRAGSPSSCGRVIHSKWPGRELEMPSPQASAYVAPSPSTGRGRSGPPGVMSAGASSDAPAGPAHGDDGPTP